MRCNVFYIGKFSCAVLAYGEAGSGSGVASTISDPSIFFKGSSKLLVLGRLLS